MFLFANSFDYLRWKCSAIWVCVAPDKELFRVLYSLGLSAFSIGNMTSIRKKSFMYNVHWIPQSIWHLKVVLTYSLTSGETFFLMVAKRNIQSFTSNYEMLFDFIVQKRFKPSISGLRRKTGWAMLFLMGGLLRHILIRPSMWGVSFAWKNQMIRFQWFQSGCVFRVINPIRSVKIHWWITVINNCRSGFF